MTWSFEFGEHGVSCRRPDKWSVKCVEVLDILFDHENQFFETGKCSTRMACCVINLNQISAWLSVVNMPPWAQGEPAPDGRMLVCGVVVPNAMNIHVLGHIGVDMLDERQWFMMSMARLAFDDNVAIGNIKSSKERRRPVACVVMRHPLNVSQSHREPGLSPIQGLNLALFVNT
jgi:hypothetical protein